MKNLNNCQQEEFHNTANILKRNFDTCGKFFTEGDEYRSFYGSGDGAISEGLIFANELNAEGDVIEEHDKMVCENNNFILAIERCEDQCRDKESSVTPGYFHGSIKEYEENGDKLVSQFRGYLGKMYPVFMSYK